MIEFYEDDGIEIDDVSFLASTSTGVNETSNALNMEVDSNDLDQFTPYEIEFMGSLRTEVAEVGPII